VAWTGRRVGSLREITQPGDYYGPTIEVEGEDSHPNGRRGVWFLLPIADPDDPMGTTHDWTTREGWLADRANGLHHVTEPPWSFTEHPDGSLSIQASIACGRGSDPGTEGEGEYFHGYLDAGHRWRLHTEAPL